jgi:hypothetical protein
VTASAALPAQGGRPRAHREALAEMYLAFRDDLLAGETIRGSGCWAALYWQAIQESPTADARTKLGALMSLLSELARLADAWCEQIDAAVDPLPLTKAPPEPENPAVLAQGVRDAARWLDRSTRALRVGVAEMRYLADELEGTSAAQGVGAEPFTPSTASKPKAKAKR